MKFKSKASEGANKPERAVLGESNRQLNASASEAPEIVSKGSGSCLVELVCSGFLLNELAVDDDFKSSDLVKEKPKRSKSRKLSVEVNQENRAKSKSPKSDSKIASPKLEDNKAVSEDDPV